MKTEEIALELLKTLHNETMDDVSLSKHNVTCSRIISQKIKLFSEEQAINILAHAMVLEVLTAQELRRKLEGFGN